jgi:hypothetical protein
MGQSKQGHVDGIDGERVVGPRLIGAAEVDLEIRPVVVDAQQEAGAAPKPTLRSVNVRVAVSVPLLMFLNSVKVQSVTLTSNPRPTERWVRSRRA